MQRRSFNTPVAVTFGNHENTQPIMSPCQILLLSRNEIQRRIQCFRATDVSEKSCPPEPFQHVYCSSNDHISEVVRFYQEIPLLATRVFNGRKNTHELSFWQAFSKHAELRKRITTSTNPYEDIWRHERAFGYKLATTFMPEYAKAIYQLFLSKAPTAENKPYVILDPCSGWGDRLLAALCSPYKISYIGFDPNKALCTGYTAIAECCGASRIQSATHEAERDHVLRFECGCTNTDNDDNENDDESPTASTTSDKYKTTHSVATTTTTTTTAILYSCPFETHCSQFVETQSVDLIMTSPPFFEYEVYNPVTNPSYVNWIDEFYRPFFQECARVIKPNRYVVVYLEDTSNGESIQTFIENYVERDYGLVRCKPIGFMGVFSSKLRSVWVFQKQMCTVDYDYEEIICAAK